MAGAVRFVAICIALLCAGCSMIRGGGRSLVVKPGHEKPITVWFDATANWERLANREQVAAMMEKCREYEIDIVVVDVKPISGYVLHNSKIAPKMREWKGTTHPEDFDLLQVCIEEGHARGLKVLASMNFFSEGHLGADVVPKHGTVLDRPHMRDWQSVDHVVMQGDTEPTLVPAEAGTRGYSIFVSAANPAVVDYELSILEEILQYDIDGVCLDRVRFSGITADFSPAARASFERYLGRTVANWPGDIFTYSPKEAAKDSITGDEATRAATRKVSDAYERVPGPLYKQWLAWRAHVIHDIIIRARKLVRGKDSDLVFADYTGAWYPEYFDVGVNWASKEYDPSLEYDWALPEYREAAYAEELDVLYSGWYYTHVTEEEAKAAGTHSWASMEGTAKLVYKVVGDATQVHGSLYVFQYKDDPQQFSECMRSAYDLSDGLMIFDLVYLEQYRWWDQIRTTFPERFEK